MKEPYRPVVAIVQARMGSTRFPGKVLADLVGRPVLHRVVSRLCRSTLLDEVIVATSTSPGDDAIVDYCAAQGWRVERGSEDDVLDRYCRVAELSGAHTVVRVTADCPAIDHGVVDQVIQQLVDNTSLDYCSNTVPPRSFPRGLDVEAVRTSALEQACAEARSPDEREHVTPFIWRQPQRYGLRHVTTSPDRSGVRWTVDTAADLEALKAIYRHFSGDDTFTWQEALQAWDAHDQWAKLNAGVAQREVATRLIGEGHK